MNSRIRRISLLAGLALLACSRLAVAQPNTISVEVIATFDYPRAGYPIVTTGQINDRGEVVGTVEAEVSPFTFTVLGFERMPNGRITLPFAGPSGHYAQAFGINGLSTICGFYADRYGGHGFLLSGGSYTTYDAPGATATAIFGNNDAGDFVGGYSVVGSHGSYHPYANIGGNFITIGIPQNLASIASGINNLGEVVGSADGHMFLRDPDGTLTYPIDAPGHPYLYAYAINDKGMIAGGANAEGFVWRYPDIFVTFSVAGSTYTEATGINNYGFVSGRYEDSDGNLHGFIAQARLQ